MTLTKEQVEEVLEAAKPLMEWIALNCHPHCAAIVTNSTIELTETVCMTGTNEFIED